MLYAAARSVLFKLDAEKAHQVTLKSIDQAHQLGMLAPMYRTVDKPVACMGLTFANPVGLAAGLDKDGAHIDALAALGFGFLEIGTVTPRPQPGNPKPRLFRLPQAGAIINRMGFNNAGVDQLISNVRAAQYRGILGINIGKNADTPVEQATSDYLTCLDKVYPHASYVTLNISSPNTKGLRSLQSGHALTELLTTVKDRQLALASQHGRYVPLVLKVAPDLEPEDIQFIAEQLLACEIDGLIATNTTLSRDGVAGLRHGDEQGGLSGQPVFEKSTECLRQFAQLLNGRVALIGVGGIASAEQAKAKQAAGADLVQLYSGMIYQGPALIGACARAW